MRKRAPDSSRCRIEAVIRAASGLLLLENALEQVAGAFADVFGAFADGIDRALADLADHAGDLRLVFGLVDRAGDEVGQQLVPDLADRPADGFAEQRAD